eukprot:CAMPEP_0202693618 /NCGR_PEP_ID=MMETSP1385-20130828/7676_1 /ASSEMBLY_ACC=CAM_ASM_000861 /TAXON_ID=933848 /ORGANISM="Elphidium margaritaceum" /LENGTH=102 /DNA_ID=CAMNT_0049349315 /DNA_START=101 /DNA_END=409 /DNA_ORIENTATION=+
MSHLSSSTTISHSNHHNHSHTHHDDEQILPEDDDDDIQTAATPIDEPAPPKKRKRTHTTYSAFVEIITNLCKQLDPKLVACFEHAGGAVCNVCSSGNKLKGV